MKMKNIILIVVVLFISKIGFSQDCPKYKENREKIEAEKVAFLTNKLDLSVKDAQAFWPVYNEFQEKKDALFIEKRKLSRNINKNLETMSDAKIIEGLNKINELKMAEVKLEKEYNDKYLRILSPKKTVLLHKSEREFKRTLLKKLKHCNAGN